MSDALTDGERMTREYAARTAGMKWCSKHFESYTVECPTCADLRRIYDKAIAEHDAQVAKRKDSDYRRGLIDGLREAAHLSCVYCQEGEEPEWAGWLYVHDRHADGWIECYAGGAYKRIAELEAE